MRKCHVYRSKTSINLFIARAHSLTSGGVVHVKVDLHLDSVQSRRGHIQQATYTSLKREGEGGKGQFSSREDGVCRGRRLSKDGTTLNLHLCM